MNNRLNVFNYIDSIKAKLFAVKAYSQEGEDMILLRYFAEKKGFYVDVGAYHPVRFSNTYQFYKKKWNGINIDSTPNIMKKFNAVRPRDINIECAVSTDAKPMNFFLFNEPALNTCIEQVAHERVSKKYFIIKEITVVPRRLDDILDKHLPKDQQIDFLSVDVEGNDLKVLQSNNWKKYRPKFVLVETMEMSRGVDLFNDSIYKYLTNLGYEFYAKTVFTLFFIDKTS